MWTVGGGKGGKPVLLPQAGLAGTAGSFLIGSAQSQLLAVGAWPLSSLPAPPPRAALLSLGLAHQSLLVLMLGCDVPLLRELSSRTEQSHW